MTQVHLVMGGVNWKHYKMAALYTTAVTTAIDLLERLRGRVTMANGPVACQLALVRD